MEETVSERRKAFAYIASRRVSSVIAKAKAEAWQTTCSSFSPKSNPKSVYSLLRSVSALSSCVCVCVYPSSSLGWRYGMNGNSGSCRQPN